MLSSQPVVARVSGICTHCLEFRDPSVTIPAECQGEYPLTFVIPYDCTWFFSEDVVRECASHRAARLLGRFTGKDPERLSTFTQLETLSVSRFALQSAGLLRGLRALRSLQLDDVRITMAEAVDSLPALASLELTQCRGKFDLGKLAGLRSLRVLRIAMCPGVDGLPALGSCRSLARLDIEARELPSVACLADLAGLEVVNLAVERIHDNSLSALCDHPRLRRLGIRRSLAKRSGLAAGRAHVQLLP